MPNPAIIAAAITAGAGLVNSGINAISTARTNRLQVSENERAFARSQKAIREQNIYNSPAQQVARLRASGLNTQMAYGNGDIVSSTQNDVATAQPADLEAPQFDFSSPVASAVEVREQFNKNSLALSLKAVQDSSTLLNTSVYDLNRKDLEFLTDTFGYRVDTIKKNLDLLNQEGEINSETIEKLKTQNKIQYEILEQEEWNTLMAEGRFDGLMIELDISREQLNQLREIFPKKLALMDSEAALNWAKSSEAAATIGMVTALADKYHAETYEQEKDTMAKDRRDFRGDGLTPRERDYRNRSYGNYTWNASAFGAGMSQSMPLYYKATQGLVSTSTNGQYYYHYNTRGYGIK